MMLKLYSLYDNIGQEYNPPIPFKNDNVAFKSFKNMQTAEPDKWQDFTLYCLGTYNTESGHIEAEVGLPIVDYAAIDRIGGL